MATVPTLAGQAVRTNPLPDVRMNPAAFGAGVSQGLDAAARGLQSVAVDQQNAEDQRIKTAVARADVDWMTFDREQRLGDSGLFRKAGQAAVEARPVVEAAYTAKRDSLLASATTQREREVMTDLIGRRYQSSIESITEFTTRAAVDAQRGALGARVDLESTTLTDTISSNWSIVNDAAATPEARAAASGRIAAAQASFDGARGDLYSVLGTPPALRESEDAKAMSGVHYTVLKGLVGSGKVKEAESYLAAHQPEILPAEENAILPVIREESIKRDAETFADGGAVVGADGLTFTAPVSGPVSSGYGERRAPVPGASSDHNGVDYAVPVGTPVVTVAPGVVISVATDGKSGNFIRIRHPDGSISGYAHLSKQDVEEGQEIAAGTIIGKSGKSGTASGPNLHFTLTGPDGKKVDPATMMGRTVGGSLAERRAAAEAAAGPDPARRAAYRAAVDGRYAREEQERADRERAAADAVQRYIQPDSGITAWTQIPANIWNDLSPQQQTAVKSGFATAGRREDGKSDPLALTALYELYGRDPKAFARLDPLTYYGKLSSADYEQMLGRRAEVQQGRGNTGEQLTMSRVMGVAQRQLSVIGLDPKKDATQLAQFQAALWNEVQRVRVATGKEPDDGVILGITRELLRNVEVDGKKVRGYQAPATAAGPVFSLVPKDAAKSIRASYAAAGKPAPTSQELSAAYREGLRLGIFMPPEK